MKESVHTALSWIKSNIKFFSKNFDLTNWDLHVHVPDAAIPKDGPSAGITICCSLVSLLVGIPLRNDTAMTGEISLAGFVLPVGGIKEKLLGGIGLGIKRFILSSKNRNDVLEIIDQETEIASVE